MLICILLVHLLGCPVLIISSVSLGHGNHNVFMSGTFEPPCFISHRADSVIYHLNGHALFGFCSLINRLVLPFVLAPIYLTYKLVLSQSYAGSENFIGC